MCSCRTIVGITDIREYKPEDIKTFLQQNKLSDSVIYFIDSDYKKSLFKLTNDSVLLRNHLQPLQASYYNREGALISFHVNCYAPGFPDLNWNYNAAMGAFPPKTQAPADTLLNFQKHFQYLKSNGPAQMAEEKDFDYYIVVYWAGFMKRQSEVLIDAVRENLKLNTQDRKVKIIYVCTDNVFLNR
jgi:hypothetical protein